MGGLSRGSVTSGGVISRFLQLESAGGIILLCAAVVALVIANTPANDLYQLLLATPVEIRVGELSVAKRLLLWINDGLMAVFFCLVGLELKRELLEGHLSSIGQALLPGAAALGGMAVPALIYFAFNYDDPLARRGWAIPAATDIAFAMGVLALLGNRISASLKVFLVALAIFDDLGAVVIIAIFFTPQVSALALLLAGIGAVGLVCLNVAGVKRIAPYVIIGVFMWVCVLKSGVHATLAGVILALAIPLRTRSDPTFSPLRHVEHEIHPWVAFGILPLFAFANAGVLFEKLSWNSVVQPVPLGIAAGLFIGKQVGVFGASFLIIKSGLAQLPKGSTWLQLYGVSILTGIGFTMSLFIGSLAFEGANQQMAVPLRLGVLLGSVLAGICGYALLRAVGPSSGTSAGTLRVFRK